MSYKGGNAVDVGECVFLPDQNNPIINMNNGAQSYLKSGNLLVDQDATYPDVYSKFSTSGINFSNWKNGSTLPTISNGGSVQRIYYLNGQYFFVLTYTSSGVIKSRIFKTTDFSTFTTVVTPMDDLYQVFDMVYANGLYVVVGANGNIITSPNLTTWTARQPAAIGTLSVRRIIYSGTYFLAITGDTYVIRSLDGFTWTATNYSGASFDDIVVTDTNVIILNSTGTSNTSTLYRSSLTDGISFTTTTISGLGNFNAGSITWLKSTNRLLLNYTYDGTTYNLAYSSGNTSDFTTVTTNPLNQTSLASAAFFRNMFSTDNTMFVFTATDIAYSKDGVTFSLIPNKPTNMTSFNFLTYLNNQLMLGGSNSSTPTYSYSPDSKYFGLTNKVIDTDGISVLYTRIK